MAHQAGGTVLASEAIESQKNNDGQADNFEKPKAGLKLELYGEDGTYKVVEECKYCHKVDPLFKERAIYESHLRARCKALKNCDYCHDRIMASEEHEHKQYHCRSGPFKACHSCNELWQYPDEYNEHIRTLPCQHEKK